MNKGNEECKAGRDLRWRGEGNNNKKGKNKKGS